MPRTEVGSPVFVGSGGSTTPGPRSRFLSGRGRYGVGVTDDPDRYEAPDEYAALPIAEFAFPGELRDRLVAAVLAGHKTTTSCLYVEFEQAGEEPPEAGDREVVVDSDGRPVAVVETTGVRVLPLAGVDRQHALDEGEGYEDAEGWRRGHEEFWHGAEYREAIGKPGFTVDDGTLVVAQRFRLVEDLRGRRGR